MGFFIIVRKEGRHGGAPVHTGISCIYFRKK